MSTSKGSSTQRKQAQHLHKKKDSQVKWGNFKVIINERVDPHTTIKMPYNIGFEGELVAMRCTFPAGCCKLVGVNVNDGTRIFPPDSKIRGDGEPIWKPINGWEVGPGDALVVEIDNQDQVFDHTINIELFFLKRSSCKVKEV